MTTPTDGKLAGKPTVDELLAYANGLAEIDPAFGKAAAIVSLLSALVQPDAEMVERLAAAIWGGFEELWDQPENVWESWKLGSGMGDARQVAETRQLMRRTATEALAAILAHLEGR